METIELDFQVHPRIFEELGERLVTNDLVAFSELVKNSYDAFAQKLDIEIQEDYIEIRDDGEGMSEEVLRKVWTVLFTPNKKENRTKIKKKRSRVVSGEKGIGRLSAARLGSDLELITKTEGGDELTLKLNWDHLSTRPMGKQNGLSGCKVTLSKTSKKKTRVKGESGTILKISGLKKLWSTQDVEDLESDLKRFLSPFSGSSDFRITLNYKGEVHRVENYEFFKHPTYKIFGNVSEAGVASYTYEYIPLKGGNKRRIKQRKDIWHHVKQKRRKEGVESWDRKPECGCFRFEINAWELDKSDVAYLANSYNISKSEIEKAIRINKGISLYRDNIIVLPKTSKRHDWLGLDQRRISNIGRRFSTKQVIGYVEITGKENPNIIDTSDRERLFENNAGDDFQDLLIEVVGYLESQRNIDRNSERVKKGKKDRPLNEIMQEDASPLVDKVKEISESGGTVDEVVNEVEKYRKKIQDNKKEAEQRVVYYSRLASIGTLVNMLLHEIRNSTASFGSLVRILDKYVSKQKNVPYERIENKLLGVKDSIRGLDRLVDVISPLSNRKTRRKKSTVKNIINSNLELLSNEIQEGNVYVKVKCSEELELLVDPGDLTIILTNLLHNSLYWLGTTKNKEKIIEIDVRKLKASTKILFRDNGPGVPKEMEESVFLPGISERNNGYGMGLAIIAELITGYNGELYLNNDCKLGGAEFGIEIPA